MKEFIVQKEQRFDTFLAQQCPGVAKGYWHKYWRQNKIKVNGKRIPLNTRVQPGYQVILYLPPDVEKIAFSSTSLRPAPDILFEDEHLLALQKPAGLISIGKNDDEDSLLMHAQQAFPLQNGKALHLCHRLDTGTSGVILLAKTDAALTFIKELLKEHRLQKTYLCLCLGLPHPTSAHAHAYLWKDAKQARVFISTRASTGAKHIETQYRTIKHNDEISLLEVLPHTGRTHQIRAHLAFLGTPLLGDSKYGRETENRKYHCRYQCLCAKSVQFPNDITGPFSHYRSLSIQAKDPWFLSLLP